MRKLVPLLIVLLCTLPNCARGQAPGLVKPYGSSESTAPPSSIPSSAPASPTPISEGDPEDWPWNPDVHHANVWPYDKAVQIDSGYFGPPGEFWLRGDYLFWAFKGERLPPLASAGPTGSSGVLGAPGVAPLFGGSNLDQGGFSGGRFEGGVWFDSDYTCGFEGSYFFAAEKSVRFNASAGGQASSFDLAEPFVSALTGQATSFLLASAGMSSGLVMDQVREDLQGGEANLVWNLRRKYPWTIDLVGGFRYLNLNGSVNLASEKTELAAPTAGTSTEIQDLFSVHNHFYGGQLGGRVEYRWGRLVCDLTEKLALGGNTSDIAISGFTLTTPAAGKSTFTTTGLYAQPSNIGHHSDDSFAVVDELELRAGWQFCDYFQMFVGYTFLYSSSVVRPGDVIDVTLNRPPSLGGPPLLGAPALPAFAPRNTDFWATGLNVGLEIRY
jgi:Putative beta barrel porin-7 (BBP7)